MTDSWRNHSNHWPRRSALINSHFHKEPHARVGIPARPDYDDDLLIATYILQQREGEAAARRERDALALQVLTLTNERDEARAQGCRM